MFNKSWLDVPSLDDERLADLRSQVARYNASALESNRLFYWAETFWTNRASELKLEWDVRSGDFALRALRARTYREITSSKEFAKFARLFKRDPPVVWRNFQEYRLDVAFKPHMNDRKIRAARFKLRLDVKGHLGRKNEYEPLYRIDGPYALPRGNVRAHHAKSFSAYLRARWVEDGNDNYSWN